MGASFSAEILNVSVCALEPPSPSLLAICIPPAPLPLRLGVGVKVMASNAVLIAARLPLNVRLLSFVPSPVEKLSPAVLMDTVPPVTVRVTVWLFDSISAISMVSAIATATLSSATTGVAGNVTEGASLTAVIALEAWLALSPARLDTLAVAVAVAPSA